MLAEKSYFAVTSGGRRLGIPLDAVKAVRAYEEPMALPGAAPWVSGILPGEGEVWPVLSEQFWGAPASAGDVCVVLSHRGRVLVLTGAGPEVLSGGAEEVVDDPLGEVVEGVIRCGSGEVTCVDVPKLYSALGLDYNEAGFE